MARDFSKVVSVGMARQTAYGTPNTTDGDFTYLRVIPGEMPSRPREVENLDYAPGQYGVEIAPHVGAKAGGEIKLTAAIPGFKVGYDASTDTPGVGNNMIDPVISLIGNALGSDGSTAVSSAANFRDGTHLYTRAYQSGDVSGGTGAVPTVTTPANYNEGEFFASQTNEDGAAMCSGFIKDITGSSVTLRETSPNAPAASDDVLGIVQAYLANVDRVPFTVRFMGDNAAFKYQFSDCSHKAIKFTFHAKKIATVELTLRYGDRSDFSSGGGLQAVTEFQRMAPVIGDQGGLLFYGTAGSAAATCGWHELEVEIDFGEPAVVDCHGNSGGESEANLNTPQVRISAKVPRDSAETVTTGLNPYELLLANGTAKTIWGQVGTLPGTIFAWTVPAVVLAEAVEMVDVGGMNGWQLTWKTSPYSGDTGTTAPANSPFTCAWA